MFFSIAVGLIYIQLNTVDHISFSVDSPPIQHQVILLESSRQSILKWAIATLVTMSSGKTHMQNSITYTHQAVLLAKQLSGRYPAIPLIALVAIGQLDDIDIALLKSAGYQLVWRSTLFPPFAQQGSYIPSVYADQYMKFWLWNETSFDRIVYIDSDTFFTNVSLIDFPSLFTEVHEGGVVACPTPWSKVTDNKAPITWNGGFFILEPSESKFLQLVESNEPPKHFITHYDTNFKWFDMSEMGAFMRDFPNFTVPNPIWQYCADTQICCCKDKCETKFDMPKLRGAMVHGMKPDGLVGSNEQAVNIFNHQRLDVFQDWGYDPECMLSQFYAPLIKYYVEYNLL